MEYDISFPFAHYEDSTFEERISIPGYQYWLLEDPATRVQPALGSGHPADEFSRHGYIGEQDSVMADNYYDPLAKLADAPR